jgi:hypothetical protein
MACALAACAGPSVRVNTDASASFAAYRTFAFHQPVNSEEAGFTHATRLLKAATRDELEARGLAYSEASPQLWVDFRAALAEHMRTQPATPNYNGMEFSPYASPWYPSLKAQPPVQNRYTEGTVVIQLVDASKKQLVWEVEVVDVVSPGRTDPKAAIDAAVHAAFERYPIASTKARY